MMAPTVQACDMDAAPAVGSIYDEAANERTRRLVGGGRMRVIGPDAIVTQDYVIERLNIQIDAARRVTKTWCG